jgi:hypothetical protein
MTRGGDQEGIKGTQASDLELRIAEAFFLLRWWRTALLCMS